MKNIFIRFTALLILLGVTMVTASSCDSNEKTPIVIFSALAENEESRIKEAINNEFPNVDVSINHAADADEISVPEDKCCILIGYDGYSGFTIDSFSLGKKTFVLTANTEVLFENGLEEPQKLSDLQKPGFAGMIAIPDPEISDCGYSFLLALANTMGDDNAIAYFSSLRSSASAFDNESKVLEALLSMDAAIGICSLEDVTSAIDEGKPLTILSTELGASYTEKRAFLVSQGSNTKISSEIFGCLRGKFENNLGDTIENGMEFYANMSGLGNKDTKSRLLNEIKK